MQDFDYDKFKAMQAQWLVSGRMLWYAYGNLSKEQAKQIVDQAVQLLDLKSVAKEDLAPVRVVDLSSQSDNFHRLDFTVEDASNENNCLLSYFQYDRADPTTGGK